MRFAVLGPTQVWRDGQAVHIQGARQRALLTTLILEPNQPVSLDRLAQSLWDGPQPASAVANLRTYASRLRAALGESTESTRTPADGSAGRGAGCDSSRLVTAGSGYLLRIRPDESDLADFTEQTRLGRAALSCRDSYQAASHLAAGLALWRGPIAEDVPRTAVLSARLVAVEEQRKLAMENLVEARMALGQHEEMVAELHQLTAEHPTRERLWFRLMLALYRCGDVAGAVASYGRARTAMREHLGLDPGHELAELHQAILHRDPALIVERPPHRPRLTDLTDPAQPAAIHGPPGRLTGRPHLDRFVGRAAELAAIVRRYDDADGPRIIGIHGLAGVGKSGLASRVADLVGDDAAIGWLDLRGSTPDATPLSTAQALRRLRPVLAKTSGRDRPAMLVVLDNAVDERQVRPLLASLTRATVLITSRPMLSMLDGVSHIDLAPLSHQDARALLVSWAGPARREAEPADVDRLVALCCGLPLALRIAGTRLASRPEWSVATFVGLLADEDCRLDELRGGDLSVGASLDISYRRLLDRADDTGRRAAALFRGLGRRRRDTADPAVASAILGTSQARAAAALGRLADSRLIEPAGPDQYRIFDLVRIFATRQADLAGLEEGESDVAPVDQMRRSTTPSSRSAGR